MTTTTNDLLPAAYRGALRTLLRYAIVMAVAGLLTGLSFQESAKKLPLAKDGAGLHLEATIGLALVHGHRKLSDWFVDHRVPRWERRRVPLLVHGDEILWLPGLRPAPCPSGPTWTVAGQTR